MGRGLSNEGRCPQEREVHSLEVRSRGSVVGQIAVLIDRQARACYRALGTRAILGLDASGEGGESGGYGLGRAALVEAAYRFLASEEKGDSEVCAVLTTQAEWLGHVSGWQNRIRWSEWLVATPAGERRGDCERG